MVTDINQTTKLLYSLIFQKGSLSLLKNTGLLGVYLDDYGAKKKYKDCLFFHFTFNFDSIKNRSNGPTTNMFLESITDFKTFYDFYETGLGWMLVFKYNPFFKRDITLFKQGKVRETSDLFKEVTLLVDLNVNVDLKNEIYQHK